ncbi:MAG: nucleotide exchange factor GrpE [Balneolaceae bacterium]
MSKEKTNNREGNNAEMAENESEKSRRTNAEEEAAANDRRESINEENSAVEPDQLVLDQQKRISELEQKVDELVDSNLRKTAEIDNVRKRMQRERIQLYETAKIQAVEHFLPVNDDLIRTLNAMDESGEKNVEGIRDGIRMVASKFEDALKHYNIERIDQTGVPFNVDLHDALMRREPEDKKIDSNIVLQVLEIGYRMGDRTIRHAKVIVSE